MLVYVKYIYYICITRMSTNPNTDTMVIERSKVRAEKIMKVQRLQKIKAEYSEMTTNACRTYLKCDGKSEDREKFVKLSNHYSDRQYKMDDLMNQVWGA